MPITHRYAYTLYLYIDSFNINKNDDTEFPFPVIYRPTHIHTQLKMVWPTLFIVLFEACPSFFSIVCAMQK